VGDEGVVIGGGSLNGRRLYSTRNTRTLGQFYTLTPLSNPAALRLNLPRSCLGIVIVKYTFILRKRSTSEGMGYVVYTLEPPWWFARATELRRLY
jgi:hypothetical protein